MKKVIITLFLAGCIIISNAQDELKSKRIDSFISTIYRQGNKEQAIANYKKSLQLNPFNDNAANMIKKLQEGR